MMEMNDAFCLINYYIKLHQVRFGACVCYNILLSCSQGNLSKDSILFDKWKILYPLGARSHFLEAWKTGSQLVKYASVQSVPEFLKYKKYMKNKRTY